MDSDFDSDQKFPSCDKCRARRHSITAELGEGDRGNVHAGMETPGVMERTTAASGGQRIGMTAHYHEPSEMDDDEPSVRPQDPDGG